MKNYIKHINMYLNQMIVKIYYKLYYNILKIICILFHKVKI